MNLEGGCLCGAIRYRIQGLPGRVTHCHCVHCRRSCGAAFVTWAEFGAGQFAFSSGHPKQFESKPKVTRTFCGDCGTQLTYQHADEGTVIDVTACSLDRPEDLHPQDHVWSGRMLPWADLKDELTRYELGRFDQS